MTAFVETAKESQSLDHRHLFRQLRFLELDTNTFAQCPIVSIIPVLPQQLNRTLVRSRQPLEYFDGRRLPRPIRPQQPKTLPREYLEIKPIDGGDV
jgi:hypothetical protein